MRRVIEKLKLTNLVDPEKSVEVEGLVDTGAMMLVLPQSVVDELGLRKMREVTVRYGNGKTEPKSIYGIVTVTLKGREGSFEVIGEPEGIQVLIGQIPPEQLDLIVDPGTRCVMPNPRSPDVPMVDVL